MKLADIPNAWLAFVSGSSPNTTPNGAPPTNSTPVGSIPVGLDSGRLDPRRLHSGRARFPSARFRSARFPVGSIPVGSIPVGSIGLLDLPVGSIGLSSLLLSQLPLCGDVPAPGTNVAHLQGRPRDLGRRARRHAVRREAAERALALERARQRDGEDAARGLAAEGRQLRDDAPEERPLELAADRLRAAPVAAGARLRQLVRRRGSRRSRPRTARRSRATTSVLQADIEGHLGSAPVGSIPVGSIPVGSIPVGSISIAATDIAASRLAAVQLGDIAAADLPAVVDCTKLTACATKTLGDAYAQNAIVPTVTFLAPQLATAFANAHITVNDILSAVINKAGGTGAAVGEPRRPGPSALRRDAAARDVHRERDRGLRRRRRRASASPPGFPPASSPSTARAKVTVGSGAATDAGHGDRRGQRRRRGAEAERVHVAAHLQRRRRLADGDAQIRLVRRASARDVHDAGRGARRRRLALERRRSRR